MATETAAGELRPTWPAEVRTVRRMVGALTVITIAGFGVVLAALFQIASRLP